MIFVYYYDNYILYYYFFITHRWGGHIPDHIRFGEYFMNASFQNRY